MLTDNYVCNKIGLTKVLISRHVDELNLDELNVDDLAQLEKDMENVLAQIRATKVPINVCISTFDIYLNWL